jgi:menaquinol-cytochrome c reductase iron-sulfur subunit
MAHAPDTGRRRFLSGLAVTLSGAIGAALAGIGLNTFVCPALETPAERWIRVGEVDPDRISGPRGFVVSFRQSDGWFKGSGQGVVFVTRGADDRLKVLASSCTHLGCGVRWDQAKERFLCPCHGGEYDADGAVTAGPPPKPLRALESRIEDGVLYVKGLA